MYSVVLMAALTTGVDLPDRGGCRGGCCGCSCGCHGGRRHGCCGCCGGCYGCYGCYGGYSYACHGCYGGVACHGCYGGVMMGHGHGMVAPKAEKAPKPKEKQEESMLSAPATIVVDLPADAKLLIDNEATSSTGENRVFQSPILNPGTEYQYTFTAEVVRDGKAVKAEQVVTVRGGQITPVRLTLPPVGVAQR